MILPTLLLVVSIVVLYYGAEFSLDASEKVGKKLGLSPLMVGMLLIGFGTSLPELFVGHIAGLQNKVGIAIGSLVGSNIANMCLILGISGFFTSMHLSHKSIKDQLVLHLILGFVLFFVLTRESLNFLTALPLLILCGVYLYYLLLDMRKDRHMHEGKNEHFNAGEILVKLVGGFGMLYIGGELLVKSGTDLCLQLGISEYIVSAIFIAFGTSFPELVTSIMAAVKKKETDMIVGNIVGSNMFNCAFILGSLGVYNFEMVGTYYFEIAILIFGALGLLILSLLKKEFGKISGGLYLVSYLTVVAHWLELV